MKSKLEQIEGMLKVLEEGDVSSPSFQEIDAYIHELPHSDELLHTLAAIPDRKDPAVVSMGLAASVGFYLGYSIARSNYEASH